MSWTTVRSLVEFYDGTQSWSSPFTLSPVSLADQATITGYLYDLYMNSATAAAALEAAAANGVIRMADTGGQPGLASVVSNLVGFNVSGINDVCFINDHGRLVDTVPPSLVIIHELAHIAYNIIDPLASDTYLNSAASDHRGPAVAIENAIAAEMGWDDYVRVSYGGTMLVGDPRLATLTSNVDYTDGRPIDIARLGTIYSDVLDHSSRTTELRDLFFGFGGSDEISGGDGDDYAYGGDGADTISGGGDNDVLYGDDGDDVLNGDDGNDVIFGGIGTNTIDGGSGSDVLSLVSSATSGHTVGISTASVTVAGGGTVTSVESVLGSSHADTFNFDPAGVMGLYATLGGDDIINISDADSFQSIYLAPGEGADTINVSYDWNEGGYTDLLLIGGDPDDQISINGLSAQGILSMCDTVIADTHYHGFYYTNELGELAWAADAMIQAVTDENVPGWIRYDMGIMACTLVRSGEGFELQTSTTSYLSVAIYGFESGDYGLPNLVTAPDAISNTILRSQLVAVSDTGEDYWHFPDEAVHAAISSSAVWDSLIV